MEVISMTGYGYRTTYGRSNDHRWVGIVVAEIERYFHPGIPTPDHKDTLSRKLLAGLVVTGVEDFAPEVLQAVDFRHHTFGILSGGHYEPPADVLYLGTRGGGSPDPPQADRLVVLGRLDALPKVGANAEVLSVRLEVVDELSPGRVFRVVLRKREARELAELFREVELEAVVCPVLPQ